MYYFIWLSQKYNSFFRMFTIIIILYFLGVFVHSLTPPNQSRPALEGERKGLNEWLVVVPCGRIQYFSFQLWAFQLPAEMKTPYQLRAEMESIRWNEFARPKMNLWSREPANSPYKYHTNTG